MSQYGDGQVITVTGPIGPEELGATMMHEHVFCDLRPWCHPPAASVVWRQEVVDVPVSIEVLGVLRRDPYINRDNAVLDDELVAIAEVGRFADAGGGALVEMSSLGLGGRRAQLPAVARATGVHVIAAAGFYKEAFLDTAIRAASDDELVQILRRDLIGGDTQVPAGAIGEMGTSNPMTAVESRNLTVAAHVAAETGLSVHIHLEPGGYDGLRALELVTEHIPADRVVLGHIDLDPNPDRSYISDLAKSGAYLALDTFGLEHMVDSLGSFEPRDTERISLLYWLIEAGHADRIVVSHDVATKTCLRRYGGFGYDHFLRDIVPQLLARGIGEGTLRRILVDAPRELLQTRNLGKNANGAV